MAKEKVAQDATEKKMGLGAKFMHWYDSYNGKKAVGMIYSIGASGMALVFCSLAGKLSNLVLVAPVVSMAASLMSGLLCKLPEWAGFWEAASLIFPGRWFYRAAYGQPFLIGSILIAAGWFAAGLLVSWLLSVIKKK